MEQPCISDILLSLPMATSPSMLHKDSRAEELVDHILTAQDAQACLSGPPPCASGISGVAGVTELVQLAHSTTDVSTSQLKRLRAALGTVIEQIAHTGMLQQQTPTEVSSILWALGVISNQCKDAELPQHIYRPEGDPHGAWQWRQQAIQHVCYQCRTLAISMLARVGDLLASCSSNWRSDQLASALWGLAQLGVHPGHAWMSEYLTASAALLRRGHYTPKQMAIELTSLAKLQGQEAQVR
jgi:hypothetical protein